MNNSCNQPPLAYMSPVNLLPRLKQGSSNIVTAMLQPMITLARWPIDFTLL